MSSGDTIAGGEDALDFMAHWSGGGLLRDLGHDHVQGGDDVFEAELPVFSTRLADPPFEKVDGFWP